MFLYFFPGCNAVSAQGLEKAGLHNRLDTQVIERGTFGGPGNNAGVIFASSEVAKASDLIYNADKQQWVQSLNDAFWVGFWLDRRPTEAQLRRSVTVPGHTVTLEDGSEWLIPLARCFPMGTRLPEILRLTPNGLVSELSPRFAAFSRRAEKLWDTMMIQVGLAVGDAETPEITPEEEWLLAAEALAINYRVGPEEINLLSLLTTNNLSGIGSAVVDVPTLKAVLESNVAGIQPSNTGDG